MFLFVLLFLLSPSVSQASQAVICSDVFSQEENAKVRRQKKGNWRTYEQAKTLVQALGIKSSRAFREWSKSGARPSDFPSNPSKIYVEEWPGWGEFLGTGNRSNLNREWRTYESAKAYIQKKNFKNKKEFHEWSKSGARPSDFPSDPSLAYVEDWPGWGEFLGTGNKSTRNRKWRTYEKAKTLVQAQGIQSARAFREWSKSGARPSDIPLTPNRVYKAQWEGWGEFLGTGTKSQKKEWPSYEEVKALVQKQIFKNRIEFIKWRKTLNGSFNVPYNPEKVYQEEWEGWREFLGTEWLSYEEAKVFIRNQGIQSVSQFEVWSKSEKRPYNFPSNPQQVYKAQWSGWREFLGTEWLSYEEAKAYIQKKGILSANRFREWSKSGDRPYNFPSNPKEVYKEEWQGWEEFLGKKRWRTYESARDFIQEQGILTSKQFFKWTKTSSKPSDIPSRPDVVYKDQWPGWAEFLRIEN